MQRAPGSAGDHFAKVPDGIQQGHTPERSPHAPSEPVTLEMQRQAHRRHRSAAAPEAAPEAVALMDEQIATSQHEVDMPLAPDRHN